MRLHLHMFCIPFSVDFVPAHASEFAMDVLTFLMHSCTPCQN